MQLLLPLLLLPALQAGNPAPGTYLVDTGVGVGLFEVADPHAQESSALRWNDDLADKSGRVPAPTSGWELSERVIVETDDPALLTVLVEELAPGGRVRPLDGSRASGWWTPARWPRASAWPARWTAPSATRRSTWTCASRTPRACPTTRC